MRIIISLLIALSCVSAFSLSSDRQQPYNFSADRGEYQKQTRTTILTHNAKITQGTSTLTGDKITLLQNPQTHKLERVIAIGKRAEFTTLPDGQTKKIVAKADTIVFFPQTNKVTLDGNADTNQNGQQLSSNKLYYDINTNLVTTPKQPAGKKTTIIIPPQVKTP